MNIAIDDLFRKDALMSDKYSDYDFYDKYNDERSNDDYSDDYDKNSRRSQHGYAEARNSDMHSRQYRDSRGGRRYVEERSRKKRKGPLYKFICILLAILCFIGGAVCIYAFNTLNSINYVEVDRGNLPDDYLQNSAGDLVSDNNVLNILLFGVDGKSTDYGRSDTMILLSIDNNNKKIKMTSFLRDTFVYVPDPDGSYHTKLTNAFSYGGIGLAINTIEANYGIQIDRYAAVNFESFKSIVDILGGVEVELTDREILYINCQIAQNNQSEYLDASEGKVLLCGQQALWYARNRGGDIINGVDFTEGTDWDRTDRQRKFLSAVIDGLKGASLTDIVRIANSVGPEITTNLKKDEILMLVTNALSYLRYDIEECSMPCDGSWRYDRNFAGDIIYVDDWDMTRSALKEFVYEK